MAQSLTAFNKPTSEEHQSVRWWLHNRQAVYDKDAEFIEYEEDLVTLRPGREHAWLDSSVEKMLQYCNCRTIRVSPTQQLTCNLVDMNSIFSNQKYAGYVPQNSARQC